MNRTDCERLGHTAGGRFCTRCGEPITPEAATSSERDNAHSHICDREQCQYVGQPQDLGKGVTIWGNAAIVVSVHIFFPLFWLTFPVTIPVMFIYFKRRWEQRCPACRRGYMEAVDSPRGQALHARFKQRDLRVDTYKREMNTISTPRIPPGRTKAISQARAFVAQSPIIVDTETTGLDRDDQIVEIACVDIEGNVLLSTLVKPTVAVGEGARAVHGIGDDELSTAPGIEEIMEDLLRVVEGRLVLSYNWEFDSRLIRQTARGAGLTWSKAWAPLRGDAPEHCIMLLYGRFWAGSSRRMISLAKALQQSNIQLEDVAHRAGSDAEAARRVLLHIAGQDEAVLA